MLPTVLLPTILLVCYPSYMNTKLTKAGANWVDGDRFFDREADIEALRERVEEGTHTLLTAQRRMGKTSLVRELLRRLDTEGDYATLFVDVEASKDAPDAIAEIAAQARPLGSTWDRLKASFGNRLGDVIGHIDELALSEVSVKFRAGMDTGNWQRSGDQVFEALAQNDRPVILAIDELPILVNKMVKGHDYQITPERRQAADAFLSWLRRNGQAHRGKVSIIVSGSIGLEPILRQAGLSAQANIFSSYELQPWSHEIVTNCLGVLANTYRLDLSEDVRREMCRRLRCCVPHHVQQFFDSLHEHLRREGRNMATLDDVSAVYERDLLSIRGQIDLEHYETRLRMTLGTDGYRTAIDLLTEAAVNNGLLKHEAIRLHLAAAPLSQSKESAQVDDILYSLEHDGYLERHPEGYRFISGLLQDWWYARHGQYFTPIAKR